MHIITRPRPETIRVEFQNKTFEVSMTSDGAFVPDNLGQHMIALGLVGAGHLPNPKPEFEKTASGGWGALIPMFSRYVREIPKAQPQERKQPSLTK
jgi:hypothetical protein